MSNPIPTLVHALHIEVLAEEGDAAEARKWLETILANNAKKAKLYEQPHFELVGRNLVFRRG